MSGFSNINNPNHAPVGSTYFLVVSVSSTASLTPADSFRGLYIPTTATVGIIGLDGVSQSFTNPALGVILWTAGLGVTLRGSVAAAIIGIR